MLDPDQRHMLEAQPRRAIYEALGRAPGLNYGRLARRLHLDAGHVRFHVHKLETVDLVVTKDGVRGNEKACFRTEDEHLWDDPRTRILFGGDPARNVALYIAENPGATVEEIADAIGKATRTVYDHLGQLEDLGLIRRFEGGREHAFHPRPALEDWYERAGSGFHRPWRGTDGRTAEDEGGADAGAEADR